MVQDILNDMDSDNVNSIDDTVESAQVAQILKTCYNEMMTNRNWPHQRKLVQLDGSGTTSRPNYLSVPVNIKEMEMLSYDKRKTGETRLRMEELKYKEPDDFLRYISTRNGDDDHTVTITDFSGTKLLIRNDVAPTYWTSFDDTYLVTDAYEVSKETTLQQSKSQCMAYLVPVWNRSNEAIPELPIDAFPALLSEAKSTAFLVLKQVANQKAEQTAQRQQRWLSRKAWRAAGGIQYPNYGRKK